MVYPPGHSQQVARARSTGSQRQRRKLVLSICAGVVACAVGFTAWSLSSSGPRTDSGCIAFSFMTVIGGSSDTSCGATARNLCLAPIPKLVRNGDYYLEMHRACRRIGLPTSSDAVLAQS